jgi:hypothetical protein
LAVTYHHRLLSIRELTEYLPERSARVTTVRRNCRPGNRRHRRTTALLASGPIRRPEIVTRWSAIEGLAPVAIVRHRDGLAALPRRGDA